MVAISQSSGDNRDSLFSYAETAAYLELSYSYIAHLAAKGVLHPIKLEGERQKYLQHDDVDWYKQRRAGKVEQNPIEIDPGSLDDSTATPGNQDMSLVGTLLVLVLAILVALVGNKEPNEAQLRQLKTDARFHPMRIAIKKLAADLAA